VTLPPGPFDSLPDPLGAKIEPVEGINHPAYGQAAMWITKAMAEEPSGGTLGRIELLKIWDQLPLDARKNLVRAGRVLLGREMTQGEHG
jgi:hypothetical protein